MIDFTYIKGNSYVGNSAIKKLEKLGGVNIYKYKGNIDGDIYYITDKDKFIRSASSSDDIYNIIEEYGEEIKLPEKKELPKTWEEWVEMNPVVNGEFYINTMAEVCYQHYSERLIERDCINLSSSEDAEGLLALIKLKRLRDCYNDGWKPDWEDDKQTKFCIELNFNKTNCVTFWNSNSFLSFKNAELRNSFLNNFRDLIEKAKMWL